MAAFALPQLLTQGSVDLRPDARLTPSAVVMKDNAIRREVVGQQAPGGAGAQDIEDGVDDFPAGILDRASAGLGRRQQGFQEPPFGVGEVAGVRQSVQGLMLYRNDRRQPLRRSANYRLFRHPLRTLPSRARIPGWGSYVDWVRVGVFGG